MMLQQPHSCRLSHVPPFSFACRRAPGSAPVTDACGTAGGTDPSHAGPGDAVFADTEFAKFGDFGSKVCVLQPIVGLLFGVFRFSQVFGVEHIS